LLGEKSSTNHKIGTNYDEDFFRGTLAPAFRASDRPIAIACFRLLTFFPERPDFRVPRFIARISRSTDLPAFFEYLLPLDFLVGIDLS
jgi:hypothetical protein